MNDLKIEDLLVKCQRCDGRGSFSEQKGNMTTSYPQCPECFGKGRIPTKLGVVLKEFVEFMKR